MNAIYDLIKTIFMRIHREQHTFRISLVMKTFFNQEFLELISDIYLKRLSGILIATDDFLIKQL
jgi:hypothetical protein